MVDAVLLQPSQAVGPPGGGQHRGAAPCGQRGGGQAHRGGAAADRHGLTGLQVQPDGEGTVGGLHHLRQAAQHLPGQLGVDGDDLRQRHRRVLGIAAVVGAAHVPIIATTVCPRASPLPAGAASTVPAASIPGTRGKLTPTLRPSRSFSSERLRPNASTRMRTQPSRSGGSGSVVSRRLSTEPGAESRTARMVAGEDVAGCLLPGGRRAGRR